MRQGLEQLLGAAADIEIVGAATDGEQAVALTAEYAPDVVLMDLEMPNVDGIQATAAITGTDSSIRVVVLTTFSDRDRILDGRDVLGASR